MSLINHMNPLFKLFEGISSREYVPLLMFLIQFFPLFLTHPTFVIMYCSFFYKHKMFLVLSCSKNPKLLNFPFLFLILSLSFILIKQIFNFLINKYIFTFWKYVQVREHIKKIEKKKPEMDDLEEKNFGSNVKYTTKS